MWKRTANGTNKRLFATCDSGVARCQSQHQCHFCLIYLMFEAYCTGKSAWHLSIKFMSFMRLWTVAKFQRFIKGFLWKCESYRMNFLYTLHVVWITQKVPSVNWSECVQLFLAHQIVLFLPMWESSHIPLPANSKDNKQIATCWPHTGRTSICDIIVLLKLRHHVASQCIQDFLEVFFMCLYIKWSI